MTKYYEGTHESLESVKHMSEESLWTQIDGLYGRDNLPDDPTIEQLRNEALRQTKLDCTMPETESQRVDREFYMALANAARRK